MSKLAIDGGAPVRTRPLPTGFLGARLIGEEEKAAVVAALDARQLSRVGGMKPPEYVLALERAVAARVGSSYALAVTSGTAALKASLAALGVGPGDEVIVPALNFISSPEAVLRFEATPVFAEVDDSFGLDPDDFRLKLTPRTKAVMPTHIFGQACAMDAIMAVAREAGVAVLENCAWSMGATYHGRAIGTIGDVGIYSLQAVKMITAGEGGLVVTSSPLLYERAARFHHHGNLFMSAIPLPPGESGEPLAPQVEPFVGDAYRLNEISAAVALSQVPKLDRVLAACRRAKDAIAEGIRGLPGFRPRPAADPAGNAGNSLGVIFDSAEEAVWWREALAAEGIPVGWVYGGKPVYLLPQIQELRPPWTNGEPLLRTPNPPRYGPGLCPRTESLMARALHLVISPDYTDDDCADVVAAFRKVAAARRPG